VAEGAGWEVGGREKKSRGVGEGRGEDEGVGGKKVEGKLQYRCDGR